MTRLVMIADDLTGAADAGGCFATHGLSTTISFTDHPARDADLLIRSTQSRDIDAARATESVRQAVMPLLPGYRVGNPRWVYKKIDSVLRGHPREELHALMTALGERRALVAPALPSERRTTVGGRQYIAGVPLEASDLGSGRSSSDLTTLFASDGYDDVRLLGLRTVRQGPDAVARFLGETPAGIVVADAETDADLHTLARAGIESDLRILCGSAGLARQLARVLSEIPVRTAAEGEPRREGPVLIVAGSQHRATALQIDALRHAGYPVVCLDQAHIDDSTASLHAAVDQLVAHLADGRSPVLTTTGLAPSAHGPAFVAERLAEAAMSAALRGDIGGLVLTGGEVAAGVLGRMGATALQLRGEIRPAVPWGIVESTRFPPLPVATKAGSFGDEDALLACACFLLSLPTAPRV